MPVQAVLLHYEAVLMLISLYVDDNIGRDELDEHGEGDFRALCFAAGSWVNQLATAGDTLPQVGLGKKEAVER
ncbi:MAG: hypothetical protein QW659_00520 [Sulfolobales archaeon]